jgi:hypothetical protein
VSEALFGRRARAAASSDGVRRTGNATRVSGIRGESGGVGKINDSVYAGKDGQLYRKGDNGWQEFNKGQGWEEVRPDPSPKERKNRESVDTLERERTAREKGEKRAKDYN